MKIKFVTRGAGEITPDAESEEPAIRTAIETGDSRHIRSEIMDYAEGRDSEPEEYLTVTEDDGAVLWSGWLSQHLDAQPAPAGGDPADALLALPLPEGASAGPTVRGYLVALLAALWAGTADAKYGLSGNSDWQFELYEPALKAGFAGGLTDEEWKRLGDGYGIPAAKEMALDALIAAAIERLGQPS